MKWWQIILIALAIIIAIGIIGKDTTQSTKDKTVNAKTETVADNTQQVNSDVVGLGEVLKTEYFDVSVSKVQVVDKIETGNPYSDVKADKDSRFLVFKVTFKNTDNESRMIEAGEVLVNYNGKDCKFDEPQNVLAEGYGIFLDQINPLTSKTTKLVYKIPAELTGSIYWHPGRSDSDQRILLGKL